MLWSTELFFIFFFPAVFGRPQKATETNKMMSSYDGDKIQNGSVREQFQCSWNCQITDSNLRNRIQTTIFVEKRQLRLAVQYKTIVDEKCRSRRTSRSQSGNITRHWQIRLVKNALSSFAGNAIKSFSTFIKVSFHHQVKGLCTFGNHNSSLRGASYGERSHSNHLDKILRSTVTSLGDLEICGAQVEKTMQTCIEISRLSKSNLSAQWREFILHGLLIAFMGIFTYFGPAIVCLFSATEVTHGGVRQISVEGPSPVGFRSLIGNYFFSTDYTTWHMVRKFIMRVIILPLPFLVPAIFAEYLLYQDALSPQNFLRVTHLFKPFRKLCYACYCIQAFYLCFIAKPPDAARSCIYYHNFFTPKNFVWICSHRELPIRILSHLSAVRSILEKLWTIYPSLFRELLQNAFLDSCVFTPTKQCFKKISFVRFIVMCTIVPVGIILTAVYSVLFIMLLIWVGVLIITVSFPIATFCASENFNFCRRIKNNTLNLKLLIAVRVVAVVIDVCMSCLAAVGVMFVLRSAAVGVMIFLQLTVTFFNSKESLPFLASCVLVSYYVWSIYNSFSNKYQELAKILFTHHKILAHSPLYYDFQGFTPSRGRINDNTGRIPKQLYDVACEELMPICKSVRIMVLKVTLSVIFIFLVFAFMMTVNASFTTRALMIFLVGFLPKAVVLYYNNERQKNEATDKSARTIVINLLHRGCVQVSDEKSDEDARRKPIWLTHSKCASDMQVRCFRNTTDDYTIVREIFDISMKEVIKYFMAVFLKIVISLNIFISLIFDV